MVQSTLAEALLSRTNAGKRRIMQNFILMSVCFALNHGTVTALTALASSELGILLGNISSGILYFQYTMVAAFFSYWTTANLGAKRTLIFGLGLYCLYVASYLIAYLFPIIRWSAICLGSFLGGIGGGIVWPAQGIYYSQIATLIAAKDEKYSRQEWNSLLAGIFASIFLFGEVTMKLLTSIIPNYGGNTSIQILYVFCTVIACASAVFICLIDSLDQYTTNDDKDKSDISLGATAHLAINLLIKDPRCALMLPFSASFGLGVAYMNGYFFASVVSDQLSPYAVGYIAAIVVFSAAVVALPYSRLGAFLNTQAPIVAFGSLCILLFALINLLFSPAQLGTWPLIIALAFVFGVGRSTWEGSFKATFADYFPNDTKAAFANVQLQMGIATALGFILDIVTSPTVVGLCVILCSFIAFFAQLLAQYLHHHRSSPPNTVNTQDETPMHENEITVRSHEKDSEKDIKCQTSASPDTASELRTFSPSSA
mmetsp:Transcript_13021/g.19494  ORF Transcript_13021/g.19494 Transcript_13021/m.19494 type:complete len:484 (+) Transcript_13021:105-1556(+)